MRGTALRKLTPFPHGKAPQLGRELPWKWNHYSSSLAFNPAGIGMERTLFCTFSSTLHARQPGRHLVALLSYYLVFLYVVHRSCILSRRCLCVNCRELP